jgi:hypothetical protein
MGAKPRPHDDVGVQLAAQQQRAVAAHLPSLAPAAVYRHFWFSDLPAVICQTSFRSQHSRVPLEMHVLRMPCSWDCVWQHVPLFLAHAIAVPMTH